MKLVTSFALLGASAFAQFVTPVPASMPSWVVPYPGAVAQNRQAGNTAESTYTVAAPPHQVLGHFRALFASAGLPFVPDAMGYGFSIHASAPECSLDVSLERTDPGTKVKITCFPRLASTDAIEQHFADERAQDAHSDPMKKFDAPAYPKPQPPAPPLAWPEWLVRVDGARLPVQRLQGQLRTSFLSQPTRQAIQAFYAELLAAHGFHVQQGQAAVPAQFGSWVVGTLDPDGQFEHRRVLRVDIKPTGPNFTVELSLQ